MSALLARIMLAIFMLPSAAMVMLVVYIVAYELDVLPYPYSRRAAWISAAICTWLFVAIYWILLWRKSVNWNDSRKRLTLLSGGVAAVLGGICGIATHPIDRDFGFFVFASMTILVWLPLTVFIWRETALERAQRTSGRSAVTCPTCGYNLTGLTATRCPECGTSYTVDELMSRQTSQTIE